MKRKHWQGYGTVEITLVRRASDSIMVHVKGNHEYGLEINRGDNFTLAQWMGKQFHFTDDQVKSFTMHSYSIAGVEECDYTIFFRRN